MKKKIKRFERKWLFQSYNSLKLINSLLRSPLFFREHYPPRKVNSIYFDTDDYLSIRQNLDGVSNKKKIRIRWYGSKNILLNPSIEIKTKKGFESTKENIKINDLNNIDLNKFENIEKIKKKLNTKLNTKKILCPILTTNYKREYFISYNGKVRATVDYNLKSTFLKNHSQIDIVKNFKNICILELKYSTKLDKYVRQKLKNITLRLSKNSKFVNSAFQRPNLIS